jgi:hypothetical protein
MSERREFIRVPMDFNLRVSKEESVKQDGKSQNISLRGACLSCPGKFDLGDECEMAIELGEGDNTVSIEIVAKVVRVGEEGIGVEFVGIKGINALDHLRNLVLYNAEDIPAVEKEINKRIGIERIPFSDSDPEE